MLFRNDSDSDSDEGSNINMNMQGLNNLKNAFANINLPGNPGQSQGNGMQHIGNGMKSANSTFMSGSFGKTANNTQADEEDEDEQIRLANNRMMNLDSLTSKLNQLPVFNQ